MHASLKNLSPSQKDEVLAIIDDLFDWTGADECRDFVIDIQAQLLCRNPEGSYWSDSYLDKVTFGIKQFYDFFRDLKKYEDISKVNATMRQ